MKGQNLVGSIKRHECPKSCTFWKYTIVIALCLSLTYLVMIQPQSIYFTLEHCGCQRHLKGVVIPFVEMQVLS